MNAEQNTSIEDENQSILFIMNFIFDNLKINKLHKLSSFLDEKLIQSLILEIEPAIETIVEKLEIIHNDKSYGIRYANYMNILNLLEKYFEYKKNTDLLKFTPKMNLKEKIVVNELLKEDQKKMKHFMHIFIVMSSISTKKDTYIDRISETEEKYMDKYLGIIEKYVIVDYPVEPEVTNLNRDTTKKLSFRKSVISTPFNFDNSGCAFTNFNTNLTEKLKKEITDLETQKTSYQNTIEQLKLENEELRNKNLSLTEKIEEMYLKHNDLAKELEIAKSSQINRDDIFNDLLLINQLKTSIAQKELEIEETKKEHQGIVKNYLDKISKNKKKRAQILINLQEKINECQELKAENEKFKTKNKEFQILKEKMADYESLSIQNSILKNQISDMKLEKSSLETHITKLFNQIAVEKETARKNEHLKETSQIKLKELQSEIETIKETYQNKEKFSFVKKNSQNINFNDSRKSNLNGNLLELENLCLLDEIEKKVDEKTNDLLKQIEDLKFKKNFLKEENFKLDEEIEKLKVNIKELEFKNSQLKSENEKIQFEKDKIDLSVKKIELDYKMQIFGLEKEKENTEIKNSQLMFKLEECVKSKEHLESELEKSKENLHLSKFILEKVTKEKNEIEKEFEENKKKLEKEFSNYKNSTSLSTNEEIQKLSSHLEDRNEKIKNLSDKISLVENENKNLIKKLKDNIKHYNEEVKKRQTDIDFLKKAFEENKVKIKKEHEMITNGIYETVQEFLLVKNELSRKEALKKLKENGNNLVKSFSISK